MLARYIAFDRNCSILDGHVVPNLEARKVVPTYKTPSLHDVHLSGSLVQIGVVDQLDLGYQSSGSFSYAL